MMSTIQDLGRRGHRAHGVPLSGAADPFAARLVNLLVGNPEGAAVIEFTLVGPELKFSADTVIAIGGGEFGPLPRWRPVLVRSGTTIKLGSARNGCRGYLAVAGAIDVPPVLESRSTYARAEMGGFHGRALADGDDLPVRLLHREVRNHWRIDERILPEYSSAPRVRVVRGQNAGEFDDGWRQSTFRVSPQSDRMGIRLNGSVLARSVSRDLFSLPVAPGTVQVPPDGQPIVLLADAQTIGGYPQIAHVISVDLPLMAQVRPGDTVRFQFVTLEEAREHMIARERAIGLLREGLAEKLA
jgi:antagonist of KipI